MLKALIQSMRPRQWSKNIFVFAALVFDRQLMNPGALAHTIGGFVVFCLVSSAIYIFNDLADITSDREHPEKRRRPIASGKLPLGAAWAAGIVLAMLAIGGGVALSWQFGMVVIGYVVLFLAYSKWLKHILILDVLVLAAGFVLRVDGGVRLIHVDRFSPWLYVVMTLLALYLGFGKRRAELALLTTGAASHRKVLNGYTLGLLDQFIMIVSALTIASYSLYTFSAENLPADHSMMLTIPMVVYAIFRYLYQIEVEHSGGAPEEILLADRPFQIAIALWAVAVVLIFYVVK